MNTCPQCGSPTNPTDKFCNSCGCLLPVAAPPGFAPAPPPPPPAAYGAGYPPPPPPQPAPYSAPVSPNASTYGSPGYAGGYEQQPPPPPPDAYAPPPMQGYPGQPYPAPSQQQQGYAAPGAFSPAQPSPPQPPAPQPFGAPPQPYAAPPGPPQQAYGASPQGYAQPPGYAPAPGAFTPQPEPAPPPPHRMLRGFLLTYHVNPQGEFWPLHGGKMVVGRSNAGDGIDIPLSDATISSRHASILVDNVSGTIQVEDTGSTNGTYVNEEHLGFNGRRELKDGDRIRFGGLVSIIKVVGRP